MDDNQYYQSNQTKLESLPDYVRAYYDFKKAKPLAESSLNEYLKEYHRFFDWLIAAGVSDAKSAQDIAIDTLEHLKITDINMYKTFLMNSPKLDTVNGLAQDNIMGLDEKRAAKTVNRSLTALSSLYTYLTEQAELDDEEPYFYRNVMKKINKIDVRETLSKRAADLQPYLYDNAEIHELLDFLENKYADTLTPTALGHFKKNKRRDIAMIALYYATGARLSELINATLDDLLYKERKIKLTRKGNKKDVIPFAQFALPYLDDYLAIRKETYMPADSEKHIFIAKSKDTAKKLSTRTVETFISKYTSAFGKRITTHKLRHSLATNMYQKSGDIVMVVDQLGHSNINTAALYAHGSEEKRAKLLNEE